MASIKNLKSKGRAWSTVSNDDPLYSLRKAEFASLPVAKIVAPVRRCRRAVEQALARWDRDIQRRSPSIRYPHDEAARWAKARALNGAPSVQALAAAA